ncbi:glycosyltransferase [Burkholderiales bacterium JOSHI_001]|nr:glycosyltransferase [Burkholderiales bacterium JOSHI_001]
MRILLVTEDVPMAQLGGAGAHAITLGNALLNAGHHVEFVGARSEDGFDGDNGFAGKLHRLIDFRGARWRENSTGAFVPLARPHMARRLWAAISQVAGPWDVVHYHGHNPHLGALVPATVNFVHTLHDQGAECLTKVRFRDDQPCRADRAIECAKCAAPAPNALQRWMSVTSVNGLRRASLRAFRRHRAIFVSDFIRQRYCHNLQVEPGSIRSHVIHNFVDMNRIRAALLAPVPGSGDGGRLRVLCAGRIDAAKGFGDFLSALDERSLGKLQIIVAGDGPALAATRATHESRGVCFLGWQSPSRVLESVRDAQVCVVPSILEEACPTTVLESLALGRTVLALRRGGTPELADYGQPGQLRLFESLPELAAALPSVPVPDWPRSDKAGVLARVPAIETVYRAGMPVPMPQGNPRGSP